MGSSSGKLFRFLLLVIALATSGLLVLAVWKGVVQKDQRMEQVSESVEADMKLSDMEYIEMQEGRRLWALRATEATYYQAEQKTLLRSVHLTFFLDDGGEVYLESGEGALYAGSKDIELWNDVRATVPRGYELLSQRAYYEHQGRLIRSVEPIEVRGPDLNLTGRRWEYRIPERRGLVEGEVRARVNALSVEGR
ncbi:MAG: LPS export ABC transporter periplasmic protein LptC [Syntrophobacteraceae bacterium]|jgi:LPS export ABC transporter protein LptC|nr:LPS export ABC transporter periplasmic protein LptC [Syntrophobacteraceae bacterium]MCU0588764.1 LPS export ABC transporter periplasmic protein LptC [Syntrophobacteraceae bacterium]